MFLIPMPKELNVGEKKFFIEKDTEIVLDFSCSLNDLENAKLLKEEIKKDCGLNLNINKSIKNQKGCIFLRKQQGEREGYTIQINETGAEICGNDDAGLFYGVQTLRQIIRQNTLTLPELSIKDSPYFQYRGFFHDVTRGKVPTLATLKELADRLSFYKINQLQLYIEHTFVFKNFSEVWTGKDPLTSEEILELDQYCKSKNIELVPSLSTFGHLYHLLSSKTYSHLCELDNSDECQFAWYDRMAHHTLNVADGESIEVVKSMIEEFIPLFSSDKFNICCDETFDIGKGKSAKLVEKSGAERVYVDFLKKIIECVKKYDKQVMFWGDIILKQPKYLEEIPEDVVCLNWAYYQEVTEKDTKTLAEAGVKQYVCPGVGGWNRFMNYMDGAFTNINKMISYGKKYGALGVLNTDWGDFGHINLFGNSMPGMIYGAALSWNTEDTRSYETIDEAISILEFGKDAKKLMKLIRELSNEEIASWQYIVYFMDYKTMGRNETYNNLLGLNKLDSGKMAEGYYRALELEKEVMKEGINVRENRKIDVEEFVNSARGVALANAVCLAIKKYDLNHDEIIQVIDNKELAIQLEYWLLDYSTIWRKRNKESELYRIREAISFVCRFLRNQK